MTECCSLTSDNCDVAFHHVAYGKGQAAIEAGKYTALLNATDTGMTVPQGTGYATLTVSKTGGATMAGKLADGTAFTAAGPLVGGTMGDQFVLNVPLPYRSVMTKGAKGLLAGALTFEPLTGSHLDGSVGWMKPEQTTGAFPAAIDTSLSVIG